MSTIHNSPRLPSRPGRILLGGAAIIGWVFTGTWFYMSTKRARRKGGTSKLLSTTPRPPFSGPAFVKPTLAGEYRIKHTVDPPRRALSSSGSVTTDQNTRPAAAVEPRTLPPPDSPNHDLDRSQHRMLTTGEEALRAGNGAKMQPAPQRDRGDGLNTNRDLRIHSLRVGFNH
ncbi:hypothetical protein DFH94DRAFT_689781 [Russula ochroleuca]|uniref:Uncharacterized protein n=1 Tax=Russula ochroleuca TaxID=152965 RepID=A0A9P5N0B5_9AGAM|nr:hypothetical protein DFH94DRAFT_689781 [Russula ochroleuca]